MQISLSILLIISVKIFIFDSNLKLTLLPNNFHFSTRNNFTIWYKFYNQRAMFRKILFVFFTFLGILLHNFNLSAQVGKTIDKSLDSLQQQMKVANQTLTTYGDSVQSVAFADKSLAQEYLDAISKLKTASWKNYADQVFAEAMLLPAFSGQKELMGSLLKIAKNNKIDYPAIRKKMTSEILKYDIINLMNEVAPKYAAFEEKKKKAAEGKPMTEDEAIEAKMAALNLATAQLETFMKRNKLENPRLSLDEWKKFWTDLLKDKKSKDLVLRGQKGLKGHPNLVEKEKSGSNMRDAFTALMNLEH